MPDFKARFSAGTSLEVWRDPAAGALPSRINPRPEYPHRYRLGNVGVQIAIVASVGGVEAPSDSALGGRLFVGWFAEHPEPKPSVFVVPAQSSVRQFTPTAAGHYAYVLRRAGGGGFILHVDVS